MINYYRNTKEGEKMKISVLSDIHGNLTALEVVIEYSMNQGIEYFIIAGDHISDCPHPNEVLNRISKLKGWIIRGNREEYIFRTIDDTTVDWNKYRQLDSMVWTRDELESHNIEFIRKLSDQETIQIQDFDSIRVVHGSTEDIYEHLYPHKEDRLVEILNNIDEKVLICGHTHQQWSKFINGKLVLNPGSVGGHFNKETSAEFSILSWSNDEWTVEHHKVKYDIDRLEKDFQMKGLYHKGGIWSRIVVQSLKEGVNRNIEFIEMANRNAKKLGYSSYKYIPNDVWRITEQQWNNKRDKIIEDS
ncbi:metallophosphoesterase family protein [Senegalia massiliensis]|nr:metallophosphoesterase family protein [Senegalia massiliensis]